MLDPPLLSSAAVPLAPPRRPSFEQGDGLAGGLAHAPARRASDPRRRDDRRGPGRRVALGRGALPRLRLLPCGLHPRELRRRSRVARPPSGDAPLPPFPPRDRGRGDRQELRRPPSGARPYVRDAVPARESLATSLRRV